MVSAVRLLGCAVVLVRSIMCCLCLFVCSRLVYQFVLSKHSTLKHKHKHLSSCLVVVDTNLHSRAHECEHNHTQTHTQKTDNIDCVDYDDHHIISYRIYEFRAMFAVLVCFVCHALLSAHAREFNAPCRWLLGLCCASGISDMLAHIREIRKSRAIRMRTIKFS